MKFDVIIGNPPYQKPTGTGKLWPLFIKRDFELVKEDGIVYLVTPTTWLNRKKGGAWQYYSDHDIVSFRSNLCSWFPSVGTSPGAPLVLKRPYSGETLVDDSFKVNLHKDSIPVDHKNLKPDVIEFLGECSKNHSPVASLKGDGPNWGDPTLSETPSETHKYETYYASSKKRQTVWSSEPRAGHGELKLIIGLYGNPLKTSEISTKGVGTLARYVTGDQEYLESLLYLITHPTNIRWTYLMSSDAWIDPLYWISNKPQ